jgi:uncharacterized protein
LPSSPVPEERVQYEDHPGSAWLARSRSSRDNTGEYRFRLKSRNGEIVASGESYPTKAVRRAIQGVQRAAADAKIDDKSGD